MRDEAKPAHDPQRVLGEALRRNRAQDAVLEIGPSAERIEHGAVQEPPSDRVDGEIAPAQIVLDARFGIDDDLEVVASWARRALTPRRRKLDPCGRQHSDRAVARIQPKPNGTTGDDEILDTSVRLERRPEPRRIDRQHEKVGVLGVEPEDLVADRSPDEVGVELQRRHVLLESLQHAAILAACRQSASATASISTSAPDGSFATSNVDRAGGVSPT